MATGTVTFSAATYAPGSPGPERAVVTITRWAGLTPPEGESDRYETITAGTDLVVDLEETTTSFCYRVVVSTPATLGDEVRFVTVPAGASNYDTLADVDPMTFVPTPVTPTLQETINLAVAAYLLANPATVADATALVKGAIRLAGDLAGTADAPTVPGLADKAALAHGHAIGDVTGLATALADLVADIAGKAALVHGHAIGDVAGLVAALAGKADTAHGHAIGDVTGLATALADAANVGIPTYLSSSEPAPAGPLLWIKDLGGNAYSLAIKTP